MGTVVASDLRRRLALAGLLLLALQASSGCGMALAELPWPANEKFVEQARRGAQAWGCRERSSDVFLLYVVCPSREASLGFSDRGGLLAVACPESSPGDCTELASAMLIDGAATPIKEPVAEPVADAGAEPITEPTTQPVAEPITEPTTQPVPEPAEAP